MERNRMQTLGPALAGIGLLGWAAGTVRRRRAAGRLRRPPEVAEKLIPPLVSTTIPEPVP